MQFLPEMTIVSASPVTSEVEAGKEEAQASPAASRCEFLEEAKRLPDRSNWSVQADLIRLWSGEGGIRTPETGCPV
jgi:hypothetical protein